MLLGIAMGLTGCKDSGDAKDDHDKGDHDKGDHDKGDHAKGDHDNGDHAKGDTGHAKDDHPGRSNKDGHDDHHGSGATVELDDGKRWKADQPTTEGVHAMAAIVKAASDNASMDDAARAKTAADLKAAYQQIFEKCTMTGPAHDQLHNYLVPVAPLLVEIETNAAASKRALATLDKHLASYETYFE